MKAILKARTLGRLQEPHIAATGATMVMGMDYDVQPSHYASDTPSRENLMLAKSATTLAALILTVVMTAPAVAQDESLSIPPVAWTVVPSPDRPSVQISKTATDGTTLFVGRCDKLVGPGLAGSFSRYGGADLQTVDGQSERVLFEVRGAEWKEAYAVQLRYSARNGSWSIANALAPVFVGSFARGGELTVLNSQRKEVFSFDLTGSGNAARTMRSVCGF